MALFDSTVRSRHNSVQDRPVRQAGRQASRQAGRRSSSRVVFHDEAAKTLASLSTKVQRLPSAVLESIRTVQFTSSGLDFTLTFAIASLHQGKVIISSM
jgi:hypothetical protein